MALPLHLKIQEVMPWQLAPVMHSTHPQRAAFDHCALHGSESLRLSARMPPNYPEAPLPSVC